MLDTTPFLTKLMASAGLLWNAPTFLRGLRYIAELRARGRPIEEYATPLAIEGEGAATALRWRDAGWRPKNWDKVFGEHERNSNAALIDRPPAATFTDVARFVWRRCTSSIARYGRAFVAAVRAYRRAL